MDETATGTLLALARRGDASAFERLVAPHRHELRVHCYRMLASTEDAEDVTQEALLAAWRGIGSFEQRASIRTWLYRIATNRCLNHLRDHRRRSETMPPQSPLSVPEPTRVGEVFWLEPLPDVALDPVADHARGPEARYEAREAISLAFVTCLQLLTPRQRAVLILRDVLGFPAQETADILHTSVDSTLGALKRARTAMRAHVDQDRDVPAVDSARERELVARFTAAFEAGDVDAMVGLLTEDVWLTMPPFPFEYQGPELVGHFYATVVFRGRRRFRTVPTRANGQPALALYTRDPHTPIARAHSLLVLTVTGAGISALTRFDPTVCARFGLPRTLDDPLS